MSMPWSGPEQCSPRAAAVRGVRIAVRYFLQNHSTRVSTTDSTRLVINGK